MFKKFCIFVCSLWPFLGCKSENSTNVVSTPTAHAHVSIAYQNVLFGKIKKEGDNFLFVNKIGDVTPQNLVYNPSFLDILKQFVDKDVSIVGEVLEKNKLRVVGLVKTLEAPNFDENAINTAKDVFYFDPTSTLDGFQLYVDSHISEVKFFHSVRVHAILDCNTKYNPSLFNAEETYTVGYAENINFLKPVQEKDLYAWNHRYTFDKNKCVAANISRYLWQFTGTGMQKMTSVGPSDAVEHKFSLARGKIKVIYIQQTGKEFIGSGGWVHNLQLTAVVESPVDSDTMK